MPARRRREKGAQTHALSRTSRARGTRLGLPSVPMRQNRHAHLAFRTRYVHAHARQRARREEWTILDEFARDKARDNAHTRAHGGGMARHGDRVTSSIPRELFENYASLCRARGISGRRATVDAWWMGWVQMTRARAVVLRGAGRDRRGIGLRVAGAFPRRSSTCEASVVARAARLRMWMSRNVCTVAVTDG